MQFAIINTPWKCFGFVVRDHRLLATYLPRFRGEIRRRIVEDWPEAVEASDLLPRFRRDVLDYFAGRRVRFSAPIDLFDVPPFRREVLERCRRIPYGKTASYGDLARAVGRDGAARAVGSAMAHNPLPLVIPCHRVLRSDGSLGGFSSPEGTRLKERMLRLEGADIVWLSVA